ncbi:MAG: methylmalonate-semialdehyde dehydrogenase (CoA acylating) [Chloroflexi bacterium]|nr:methylmalonate-semialdehyde dehydrogenase (CoA acylating) [Chloroflexota bacterium]MDL1884841.1 CoA-acylating methylmalonate-semialdehyde dehydrogenase [Anaerolineae bacterium CFX8]
MEPKILSNYINGQWQKSSSDVYQDVVNPATGDVIARVPMSSPQEVDLAARGAATAADAWRRVPPAERIQYLFRLKNLLEEHIDALSRMITDENGKTFAEAKGEMRRAIENVEVACGIPILMQGTISEDIAPGIDELMIRQPVGVAAIIAPFNFPGMIPFWFLPYAVATGNTVIVKPSERCPVTMHMAAELLEAAGFPPGVVNIVNGGADCVNAILDHPMIQAVSFVGSTPVARHIYARGSASGKRVQAQGGAKNPVVILPDADLDMTTRIVADSAFGNAGQRCLAASLAITVGKARELFTEAITEAAKQRVVGYGLDEAVTMGPVITPQSKTRIEGLIQTALDEGAKAILDGRNTTISRYERGNFLRPTILQDVRPGSTAARTEIFGPVLGMMHADTVDEAIALVNSGEYGNMACLFTSSGSAARKFRYEAQAGNIGINIGVAAPMAFFPFSGWKASFFGTLHGQSHHAIEFFTQTKVVIERWPKEWSRQF